MSKKSGKVSDETQADAPVVEPGKDAVAEGANAPEDKPERTRVHRGQKCPVIKVTKNTRTGAIYDHILYTRSVTNRRDGTSQKATVGKKLRRPGTGVVLEPKEVEVEE